MCSKTAKKILLIPTAQIRLKSFYHLKRKRLNVKNLSAVYLAYPFQKVTF